MNIYTRNGDRGTTSLMNGISVSKSDDRIELVGTIDELNSFIGLAKVLADSSLKESLAHIQRNLMQIMAGVADPRNMDYRFSTDETKALEEEIDRIENSFPRIKDFVLYGGCELSARLDVARSVTRRAERRFRKVEQNYGAGRQGDPVYQPPVRLSLYVRTVCRLPGRERESRRDTGSGCEEYPERYVDTAKPAKFPE